MDDIRDSAAEDAGRSRRFRALLIAVMLALSLGAACTGENSDSKGSAPAAVALTDAVVAPETTTTTLPPLPPRIGLEQVFGGLVSQEEIAVAEWVGHAALVDSKSMTAVTVGGPGLVAAGVVHLAGAAGSDAAVWTSPDGREWSRVADDAGVFGDAGSVIGSGSDQVINDVVGGSSGVVAVGSDGVLFEHDAAVWVSSAGLLWERLPHDAEVFGGEGDQMMHSVAQIEELVIIVGESAGRAAAWVSVAGRQWARADVNDDSVGAEIEPSVMVDVTATDTGFVAVGNAGIEASPAVWLSPDGHSWSRLLDSMTGGASGFENPMSPMTAIAAGERGLVVIGTELRVDEDPTMTARATWRPLVWTSADGFEWQLIESTFVEVTDEKETSRYAYLKDGSPVVLADVAWAGDQLVAIGEYDLEPSAYAVPNFVTLWVSTDDGSTWEVADEATLPATAAGRGARAFARFGESFVLVGLDDVAAGEHPDYGWMIYAETPAVWIAEVVAP